MVRRITPQFAAAQLAEIYFSIVCANFSLQGIARHLFASKLNAGKILEIIFRKELTGFGNDAHNYASGCIKLS
jgi:hypothetical protein